MTKNNILVASFSVIFASIFFVINDAIINYLSSNNITFYHFVFYGAPAYLSVPLFLLIKGNLIRNLKCENYWIPTIRGIIFAPMPFITFVSLKNITLPEFTTLNMAAPLFGAIYAIIFLNEILKRKPKNFLEIGVFHGVTSRNVCDLLEKIHGKDFSFTGIDLFSTDNEIVKEEIIPQTKFSNPLKTIYYKYIVKLDPYSKESVEKLLSRHKENVNIIKGNSNKVLKEISLDKFDYVFLDGGHKYETVLSDLKNLNFLIQFYLIHKLL